MTLKIVLVKNKGCKKQTIHGQSISRRKSNSDLHYIFYAKRILKSMGVPENIYSIGEYCENALCIEKSDLFWQVYLGERNKKFTLSQFNEFEDAFHELRGRIFKDSSNVNKAQRLFSNHFKLSHNHRRIHLRKNISPPKDNLA
ncbi:MAG: hypothetical protein WCD89_03420 [Anaerocolumna sp.]